MTAASIIFCALSALARATPFPGLPHSAPSAIQDCAVGGNYAGSYQSNQGTYVNSDSVRRQIGVKCWNDYYLVNTSPYNDPWQQTGGDKYCTGTSLCTSGVTYTQQKCLTNTNSISVGISLEVANLSVDLGYEHTWSSQNCNSTALNDACTWNDAACHTVWTQQQMVKQVGYKQERCNGGGGDFTNCMSDWTITWPSDKINIGCGSQCGDTNSCGKNDGTPCS